MWISPGRGWLAVATLALGTAEAVVDFNQHVNFTIGLGDYQPQNAAIIKFTTAATRAFTWTAASGVRVEEIRLWGFDSKSKKEPEELLWGKISDIQGSLPDSGSKTSTLPLPSRETDTSDDVGVSKRRDRGLDAGSSGREDPGQLRLTPNAQGGAVTVITPAVFQFEGSYYWEAKRTDGSSYSQLFTVIEDLSFPDAATIELYSDPRPHISEQTSSPAKTTAGTSAPTAGSGSVAPNGNSDDNNSATETPSSSGGNGGLSNPAVIGIAVACAVIGLALIGGLVWFLLRRRQQKKDLLPVDSYSSGNRREELMAEKEPSADVSPHSPYSDDGAAGASNANGSYHETTALTEGGAAVAAGGAAASHRQDASRTFIPYSDRAGSAGTPSVRSSSVAQGDEAAAAHASIPSATPGRATPRALTTPYAHLVEEGMTEEEIRRLEDEERQLDAAIEQAGAGRR